MMKYSYETKGVCSSTITFEVDGDKVKNIKFVGGCNGNLKGIAALCEGMNIDEVIARLDGIRCGFKATSCPDQLAKALEACKQKNV